MPQVIDQSVALMGRLTAVELILSMLLVDRRDRAKIHTTAMQMINRIESTALADKRPSDPENVQKTLTMLEEARANIAALIGAAGG